MSKKKTKRKIKVIPMMIAIVIVVSLIILLVYIISIPTKNILIINSKQLSDKEIIEQAEIGDYPAFFSVTTFQIQNRLKKHPLVKDAEVTRKFFHVFQIDISENDILFLDHNADSYILSDGSKIPNNTAYASPILINYISDTVYDSFLKEYSLLEANVRQRISEIEYQPSTYDDSLFVFIMNDGNYVYINTPNMESLKYYDDICATLDGKKGILYLDSGYGEASSFKIFE